jgi:hypothetical protein
MYVAAPHQTCLTSGDYDSFISRTPMSLDVVLFLLWFRIRHVDVVRSLNPPTRRQTCTGFLSSFLLLVQETAAMWTTCAGEATATAKIKLRNRCSLCVPLA